MTKQEMFDVVARHLLAQRRVSLGEGQCLYRGPRGLKCAVGCLIPDDMYSDKMEGLAVWALLKEFPNLSPFIPDHHLAGRLQMIHDAHPSSEWEDDLRRLAASQCLHFPAEITP